MPTATGPGKRDRAWRQLFAVAVATLMVAGCGGPATTSAPPVAATSTLTSPVGSAPASSAASRATTLTITDFTFGPDPLTVAGGARIAVANQDTANHTVTASDGSFDTGNIPGGGTAMFTAPSSPGRYPYKCAIHPTMTGVLIVT